jgi:hypothetical protein
MERCEAVKKFSANLTVAQRLKRYLMVRKGKILMKRGLRLLDPLQVHNIFFIQAVMDYFKSSSKSEWFKLFLF